MRSSLVVSGVACAVGLASLALACTSAVAPGDGGPPGSSSGGEGEGGSSGSSGGEGGAPGGAAGALPPSTFLYEARPTSDRDVLMAYDVESGQPRVVTDLRGDGSNGWSIAGCSLSADRTRIAVATLYGATQADVDTKLATRHIWTFAPDGSDFRRLTPVFRNTGAGRTQFVIEVRNPTFSLTGSDVFYGYGEYWYEGNTLQGGSAIWSVGAAGGALPALLETPSTCSLVAPSVDPRSGKVAVVHSVCISGGKNGIYLHAPDGSGTPEPLVLSDGMVDVYQEQPRWLADGSGFLFIATTVIEVNGANTLVRGLFAFDMQTRKASALIVPQDDTTRVVDAAIAPDARGIVYCLETGEAQDLHYVDLTKDPATDAAITNDGKSCHPVW